MTFMQRAGGAIDWNAHPTPRCALAEGFNVYANVLVPARDRLRLERLGGT